PLKDIPSPLVFQLVPIYYHFSMATGDTTFLLFQYHLAYGPVFRAGWKYVMFVNREAAEALYSTYSCEKTKTYEGFALLSPTMFSTQSRDLHDKRKRIIAPSMTHDGMAEFEPLLFKHGVLPALRALEGCAINQTRVDLFKLVNHMAWDVICAMFLGKTFDMVNNNGHPILRWNYLTLWYSMASIMVPCLKFYRPSFKRNIEKHLVQCINGDRPPGQKRLIDCYIDAKDPDTGDRLSNDDICSEMHNFLMGGTGTTTDAIVWIIYLLMTHPQVEAKVWDELKAANKLANNPNQITFAECQARLPYLAAVIKETLRVAPVSSVELNRAIPKGGCFISGYHLPEGTECTVPIYSLHMSPRLWDRPEVFLPERWLNNTCKQKYGDSYMPFLIGPRACVGKE
ncbi:hypothetical protein L0F63_003954, partial [Massospora cicadina]